MTDLLNCPFCGSAGVIENLSQPSQERHITIGCANEQCFAYLPSVYFARESEAIAAWNRRSAPTFAAGVEAALSDWFNSLPCDDIGREHFEALLAIVAPSHTDLMVSPEEIDRFIEANPPPVTEEPSEAEVEAALLIALAQANIPADVQELLVHGDPMRGILPHALVGAYAHARASQQGARTNG